jgi:hypothetical protein
MARALDATPLEDAPPLERVLAQVMSDYSENNWCAGWLMDLEDTLWDAIWGGPSPDVTSDLEEIKALAELTGAWIIWDERTRGKAIVRLGDFAAGRDQRS